MAMGVTHHLDVVDIYICHVILKYFNAWQCYSLKTNVCLQTFLMSISTFKLLDLDLGGRDMDLGRDMLSWCGRHLCQVIFKLFKAWQSIVRTRMCAPIISYCDNLNLQNISVTLTFNKDVVLGCDTTMSCDRHLCQVISKSLNAWQSNSLDMTVV
jgi:hypothetical protein